MAIHVDDLEPPAIPDEILAGSRDAAEAIHHEAAQGLKGFAFLPRQRADREAALKVLELHRAIDEPGTVLALDRVGQPTVAGLRQVADNRLHHIDQRNEALDAAELVGHEREVLAGLLEGFEQLHCRDRGRHEERLDEVMADLVRHADGGIRP